MSRKWLLSIPIIFSIMLGLGVASMFTYKNYSGIYDCKDSHNKSGGCLQSQIDEHEKYENTMFVITLYGSLVSWLFIPMIALYRKQHILGSDSQ